MMIIILANLEIGRIYDNSFNYHLYIVIILILIKYGLWSMMIKFYLFLSTKMGMKVINSLFVREEKENYKKV